jgi:hypothetical protein
MHAYPEARSSTAVRQMPWHRHLRHAAGTDRVLSWALLAPSLIVVFGVFVFPLG